MGSQVSLSRRWLGLISVKMSDHARLCAPALRSPCPAAKLNASSSRTVAARTPDGPKVRHRASKSGSIGPCKYARKTYWSWWHWHKTYIFVRHPGSHASLTVSSTLQVGVQAYVALSARRAGAVLQSPLSAEGADQVPTVERQSRSSGGRASFR